MPLNLSNIEGLVWNKMQGGVSFDSAVSTVENESPISSHWRNHPRKLRARLRELIDRRERQNYVKSLKPKQLYWLWWSIRKTREFSRNDIRMPDAARMAIACMQLERRKRGENFEDPPEERIDFAIRLICSALGGGIEVPKYKPDQQPLDLAS